MLRLRIDVPRSNRATIVRSRDAVKNLIDAGLSRHGYPIDRSRPARYGFGVVGKRVNMSGTTIYHRVERVIVGSSDDTVCRALSQWTADDLIEPNAVPEAGLDLRASRIAHEASPIIDEAISLYAVSPLRVLDARSGKTLLDLGPEWQEALNRTMSHRFNRPFHLRVIPDSWYVRAHQGKIVARMAVKIRDDGYVVAYPGLVLPFLLVGPIEELQTAWYSGLGGSTAMGFGCVEVAQ